jgi:hypothetical protein
MVSPVLLKIHSLPIIYYVFDTTPTRALITYPYKVSSSHLKNSLCHTSAFWACNTQ